MIYSKPAPRLPEKDVADFVRLGQRRRVAKSEYVFQAGQPASHVYLLESGQIKVLRASPSGPQVLVFVRGKGELIGIHEAVLSDGVGTRTCLAQASEDSVLSAVPMTRFLSFIAERFDTAHYVIRALSFRLEQAKDKLASFAATDIGARIARVIMHMSVSYGTRVGGTTVELGVPLTQQELADIVGATRQTVNAAIQTLKAENVITVTKNYIRIEDADRLERIARRDGPATADD